MIHRLGSKRKNHWQYQKENFPSILYHTYQNKLFHTIPYENVK